MNNNRGFFQTVTGTITAAVAVTAAVCVIITGLCCRMLEGAAPGVLAAILSIAVITAVAALAGRSVSARLGEAEERVKALKRGEIHIEHKKIDPATEADSIVAALDELAAQMDGIIKELSQGLTQIAEGNLNYKLPRDWQGDFGKIAQKFNIAASSLGGIFKDIGEASSQVSSRTEHVASGAQSLSQGATEQAASIEELTSQISDISERVTSTAQSARSTSDIVKETAERIAECSREMDAMLASMDDINKSSEEISKIIKVIDDIAFQTNILALNAAVEAARAGSAGKGFAVVADEVRNLAAKSAEAASQTTSLIENSVANVGRGSEIAKNTAKTLETIVQNASLIEEEVAKISETSEYQAQEIKRVTDGVEQISSVVKSNTATAEESAAASRELSGQSGTLSKLLSHFRFDGNISDIDLDSSSYDSFGDSFGSSSDSLSGSSSGYDDYSSGSDSYSSFDNDYSDSSWSSGGGGYEEPSEKPAYIKLDDDDDYSSGSSFSDDFNNMVKDSDVFSGGSSLGSGTSGSSDSLKKALGIDTADPGSDNFVSYDFSKDTPTPAVSAPSPAPAPAAKAKPAMIVLDDDDFENVKSKY